MDQQIWNRIKSGNKDAFKEVFDTYYSSLCLYANSVIHNIELAQDIVSDCFIRVWESRENIQIESSLKYYLLVSVRNALYAYLRSPESRKEDINPILERLENVPIDEYNLEKDQTIQRVYQLIEELPAQRKRILELAAFKGKTYLEIAEMLNISVNTVKTHMSRAYRFLREHLNEEDLLLYFFFKKD